jgi:hypothetical protein
MNDTCNFEICALRKKLKIKNSWECPNYIEMTWKTLKDGHEETKTTKDCAPKRTVCSINDILARILTLQKSDEESRNVAVDLMGTLAETMNVISKNPNATLSMNFNQVPSLPLIKNEI